MSVKVLVIDDNMNEWPMTHILKFHKSKYDSDYQVMRFKISNLLGEIFVAQLYSGNEKYILCIFMKIIFMSMVGFIYSITCL